MASVPRILTSDDPSPSPSLSSSYSLYLSPSPSSVESPFGTPGSLPHKSNQRLTVILLVLASVVATFFLLLTYYAVLLRRRRHSIRSRSSTNPTFDGRDLADDGDHEDHHVWHIRTEGLDETAIESIPFFEFRCGDGGKIADGCDCSVCLGDFEEGELVRLLPRCGHAFHLTCVDMWLRSHVSCPLCRVPVAAAAAIDATDVNGSDSVVFPSDGGDLDSFFVELPLDEEGGGSGSGEVGSVSLLVAGSSSSATESQFLVQSIGVEDAEMMDGRLPISMDPETMVSDFTLQIESERGVKEANCVEGDSSQSEIVEMERCPSSSSGNSFLSRLRGRSSSILPL